MSKTVYKVDEQGFLISFLAEHNNVEIDVIDMPLEEPFYKPKFDGEKWLEGATKLEIEEMQHSHRKPNLAERNRSDIDYLAIMTGVDL